MNRRPIFTSKIVREGGGLRYPLRVSEYPSASKVRWKGVEGGPSSAPEVTSHHKSVQGPVSSVLGKLQERELDERVEEDPSLQGAPLYGHEAGGDHLHEPFK